MASGDKGMEMFCAMRPCRMDYVEKDRKILQGDEVVTSGLGGVFPEGLLLGHVVKADMDPSGLYQLADVMPAAEMEELKYVFVVAR